MLVHQKCSSIHQYWDVPVPSSIWDLKYTFSLAYLTRVNTAYHVTHLYTNRIYARDEGHDEFGFLDWNIYFHKGCNYSNETSEMM